MSKDIIARLDNIITKSPSLKFIPQVSKEKISINLYDIIETNGFFTIIHAKDKKILNYTWTKAAAIALVHTYLLKNDNEKEITELDALIEKNKRDSNFYRYSLKHQRNKKKKMILHARLDLAENDIHYAKSELLGIIFDRFDK